jgi:hypothetical protein
MPFTISLAENPLVLNCARSHNRNKQSAILLVEGYPEKTLYLAKWLEDNVPEGLAVFTLPDYHHGRLPYSNPIERDIKQ